MSFYPHTMVSIEVGTRLLNWLVCYTVKPLSHCGLLVEPLWDAKHSLTYVSWSPLFSITVNTRTWKRFQNWYFPLLKLLFGFVDQFVRLYQQTLAKHTVCTCIPPCNRGANIYDSCHMESPIVLLQLILWNYSSKWLRSYHLTFHMSIHFNMSIYK